MKVFLIKNSSIDAKNIIEHNNNFLLVEQYLEVNTNYNSNDFENLISIDIKDMEIEQLQFSKIFTNGNKNGDFILEDVSLLNGAIIENHPFIKQKSYWLIEKKKIINSDECEITFIFHSSQTWGIGKLNLEMPLQIEKKHFNYVGQFLDPSNRSPNKLKTDSIFREMQPSGDIDIIATKKNNFFKNEAELKIIQKWLIEKWVVVTIKKDDDVLTFYDETGEVPFDDKDGFNILVEPTNSELNNNKIRYKYPNLYINLYVPLLEAAPEVPFNIGGKIISINGLFQLNQIIKNEYVYDLKIIDNLPSNKLSLNDNDEIEGFDLYAKIKDAGGYWFADRVISKENSQVSYSPISEQKSKLLYDFKLVDKNYNNDLMFESNQILELNFEPFKYFTFEFYSEVIGTGWHLNNNQLRFLPKVNQELFKRNFNYAPYSLEYIDEVDVLFGSKFNKTKRSILLPVDNDAWMQYNQQKLIRGTGEFIDIASTTAGAAATGFSVGGFPGAIIGAGIGFGLSTIETILNQQAIKQTPNTAQGSATEINTEALSGYDSKSITIYEPIDSQIKKLAFEFHKEGIWCYNFNFTIDSIDDLLPKDRFNFLKLSKLAQISVIKNDLDDVYRKNYLENFQNGITLWNWNTKGKAFIFDYKIKNPDRNNNMMDETILYEGSGVKEQTHNFVEPIENFQFLEIRLYDNDGDNNEYINLFITTNNLIGAKGTKRIWVPYGIGDNHSLDADIRLTSTTIYHTAITSSLTNPWMIVKGINRIVDINNKN